LSRSGNDLLVEVLDGLGVTCAFGLPGTQNVGLFEALRGSSIRTVLSTSELSASFMACGYARASGNPGVLLTIPGPGFTFGISGLAEARLDSTPLLHILPGFREDPQRSFRHQVIPQRSMVEPLAKGVISVSSIRDLPDSVGSAWSLALSGEPGPVVLEIAPEVLSGPAESGGMGPGSLAVPPAMEATPASEAFDSHELRKLFDALRSAKRPLFFLGLGSVPAARTLSELIRRVGGPVITTPSARGVFPEDHPLSLAFDPSKGGLDVVNEVLAESDLVLALGCKMSHNGTAGFRLRFPQESLFHVNSDPEALGRNYPASQTLAMRVEELAEALLSSFGEGETSSTWSQQELTRARRRLAEADPGAPPEPRATHTVTGQMGDLIKALRGALPRDGILTLDSGLHQVLVRRHFEVFDPAGLILPSDFQSMGFGLPAAIGAKLAHPARRVVSVIGDGGLAMSGMELLTLVREKLPVTVVVFHDRFLNLIRLQQEADYGRNHAVRLHTPDMEAFAEALGAGYMRVEGDPALTFEAALGAERPTLVEVVLGDTGEIRSKRRVARAKADVRGLLGQGLLTRIKALAGRIRRG
jgi:acetolactate synthase-1/2/3 large subunit